VGPGAERLPGAETRGPQVGRGSKASCPDGESPSGMKPESGRERGSPDQRSGTRSARPINHSKHAGLVLVSGVFGSCLLAVGLLGGCGFWRGGVPASRARQRDRQERVAGTGCFQRREVSRFSGNRPERLSSNLAVNWVRVACEFFPSPLFPRSAIQGGFPRERIGARVGLFGEHFYGTTP
jgi:hypothetical protein